MGEIGGWIEMRILTGDYILPFLCDMSVWSWGHVQHLHWEAPVPSGQCGGGTTGVGPQEAHDSHRPPDL